MHADSADARRSWPILAAAIPPGLALTAFCLVAIREWWLIASHQQVVVHAFARGATSAPEVPAWHLVPLILGSGALAVVFAYAGLKRSTKALIGGYATLALAAVIPLILRLL